LSICPLHIHAKRMLKACQVALDEGKQQKEYQGRRNSTLRQAREAIEQSQYARTLLIVNRVLEIEPTQLEAGLLRDVAREREALDASDKKRRISELLEACRVQLRAGEYDEALKASEELMKLSPEESEVLEQQKSLKRMIKPDSE
jgi:tetratricopeptide (TPR) repeat protein